MTPKKTEQSLPVLPDQEDQAQRWRAKLLIGASRAASAVVITAPVGVSAPIGALFLI